MNCRPAARQRDSSLARSSSLTSCSSKSDTTVCTPKRFHPVISSASHSPLRGRGIIARRTPSTSRIQYRSGCNIVVVQDLEISQMVCELLRWTWILGFPTWSDGLAFCDCSRLALQRSSDGANLQSKSRQRIHQAVRCQLIDNSLTSSFAGYQSCIFEHRQMAGHRGCRHLKFGCKF